MGRRRRGEKKERKKERHLSMQFKLLLRMAIIKYSELATDF